MQSIPVLPGYPIPDISAIQSRLGPTVPSHVAVEIETDGSYYLLVPVVLSTESPDPNLWPIKDVVRVRAAFDLATFTVAPLAMQPLWPCVEDGLVDSLLFGLAGQVLGWSVYERATKEDAHAGAGNNPPPPHWREAGYPTETWEGYILRYPPPNPASPEANNWSINEGSIRAYHPLFPLADPLGSGNIGTVLWAPDALLPDEDQWWVIGNIRGFYPARRVGGSPHGGQWSIRAGDFPVIGLDPNRSVDQLNLGGAIGLQAARGVGRQVLKPVPRVLASDTAAAALLLPDAPQLFLETTRERWMPIQNRDGNTYAVAFSEGADGQFILDATGRVPVGGWPSGVSAGWLQKMWGLIFQPKAELDERTAGAGATANPGGTDNSGLGNFGAVFLDAVATYVVVNEDGVFPALLAANGKIQLSGAAFSTITFGGLLGYGMPGGVGAFVILGGQLGGSKTVPDVRGLRETGGPTLLTMGAVADGQVLKRVGSDIVGFTDGGGTVTSVAISLPAELTATGSPITTAGTLALSWAATAPVNYGFMGPASDPGPGMGTPAFRALVAADIPATLNSTTISTVLTVTTIKPPADFISFQATSGTECYLQGATGHNLRVKAGTNSASRIVHIYDDGTQGQVLGLPSLLLASNTNDVILKPKNDVVTMTPGSSAVAGTSIYMQAVANMNFQIKAGNVTAGRLIHLYDDLTDARIHGWPSLKLTTQSGNIELSAASNTYKIGIRSLGVNANVLGGSSLSTDAYVTAASGFLKGTPGAETFVFGATIGIPYGTYCVGSYTDYASTAISLLAGTAITLTSTGANKITLTPGSSNVNISSGALEMGGTTVIGSSRQMILRTISAAALPNASAASFSTGECAQFIDTGTGKHYVSYKDSGGSVYSVQATVI